MRTVIKIGVVFILLHLSCKNENYNNMSFDNIVNYESNLDSLNTIESLMVPFDQLHSFGKRLNELNNLKYLMISNHQALSVFCKAKIYVNAIYIDNNIVELKEAINLKGLVLSHIFLRKIPSEILELPNLRFLQITLAPDADYVSEIKKLQGSQTTHIVFSSMLIENHEIKKIRKLLDDRNIEFNGCYNAKCQFLDNEGNILGNSIK